MAGSYVITTRASGTILTATIYNADHQNHVDNAIPQSISGYSANVAQMQSQINPGLPGSESLATTLSGEIERLRFAITRLSGLTYWYTAPSITINSITPHGQVLLKKQGNGNLGLFPFGGGNIIVNGIVRVLSASTEIVPPAGTTFYYVYLFYTGAAAILEVSATAPVQVAATGVFVKNGDVTRTLVGMARTVAGAWVDTTAQRFVLSYFNRKAKTSVGTLAASSSTASATYVEVNTSLRAEFLTWGDETVRFAWAGSAFTSGGTNPTIQVSIGIDGITPEDICTSQFIGSSGGNISGSFEKDGIAEGYHYSTVLHSCSAGGTAVFQNPSGDYTAGHRPTNRATVMG